MGRTSYHKIYGAAVTATVLAVSSVQLRGPGRCGPLHSGSSDQEDPDRPLCGPDSVCTVSVGVGAQLSAAPTWPLPETTCPPAVVCFSLPTSFNKTMKLLLDCFCPTRCGAMALSSGRPSRQRDMTWEIQSVMAMVGTLVGLALLSLSLSFPTCDLGTKAPPPPGHGSAGVQQRYTSGWENIRSLPHKSGRTTWVPPRLPWDPGTAP